MLRGGCSPSHGLSRLELVRAKDRTTDEDNNMKCQDFDAEYIGETARRLGTMLTEHSKTVQASNFKSAISVQVKSTGYSTDWNSIKVIDREDHLL